MQDHYLVKTAGGFKPVGPESEEYAKTLGLGEVVRVKFHKDRNIRHHRWFFAILKMVFENQERYLSMEGLRFALTIKAGYVDVIKLDGDNAVLMPKSIAFHRMDQVQFNEFSKAILRTIPELLPELAGVDWEQELLTSGE